MPDSAALSDISIGQLTDTPIGDLWLAAGESGIVAIYFGGTSENFVAYIQKLTGRPPIHHQKAVTRLAQQLTEYLQKDRQQFDLPIDWSVFTDFQQTVLKAVNAIPYGRLATYNDIAHAIGNPKAIRAVGRANATNPIPILLPCHRIISSNGKLHGYGGGLETKAWLLRLEGSWLL